MALVRYPPEAAPLRAWLVEHGGLNTGHALARALHGLGVHSLTDLTAFLTRTPGGPAALAGLPGFGPKGIALLEKWQAQHQVKSPPPLGATGANFNATAVDCPRCGRPVKIAASVRVSQKGFHPAPGACPHCQVRLDIRVAA
jgi:hypothetical protein